MNSQHPEACCTECQNRYFFEPSCGGHIPIIKEFMNDKYGDVGVALKDFHSACRRRSYTEVDSIITRLQGEFRDWALAKNAHIDKELWELMKAHDEGKIPQHEVPDEEGLLSLR